MSGGHVEALAGILAEHGEDYPRGCDCHLYDSATADVLKHADRHRAHVAEVLAAYVAEHQAQAWDEGYEAGRGDESFDARGLMTDSDAAEHPHDNPYREDGAP